MAFDGALTPDEGLPMAEIEREAKLTLSQGDYQRLMARGRVLERREQLNVYLHDPDRVHEGLGYFRVRYESGREPVATLKILKGWKGDVREMVEIERPLKELGPGLFPWPRRYVRVDSNLPGELGRHFLAMGIQYLRRLGWMRNLRCVVEVEGEGWVEVDRTELPGGRIQHEVEIETQDEALLRRLMVWVMETAPSAEVSTVGKFSRFLEAVGGAHPAPTEADP
jgi:hypothetical protein